MAHTVKGSSDSREMAAGPDYEQFMDSLGGIIWEANAQTNRFTYVSKGAEHLLGYPVEQWTREPEFWADHIHPEDRAREVAGRAAQVAAKQSYRTEYRMIAADGGSVWLRDILTVIVENNVVVSLRGIATEITGPIARRESLKEKEEQYRQVFEATTDGLVVNDYDGNVVEVNPAFYKMHGYTHDEMVGMDPRKFVHPDYYEHLGRFFETVRAGQPFYTQAMDVRKDGSTFHIEVYGVPFLYNGMPHILGILRDITEQLEAQKLLKLEEEQYRAVWESTTDGLTISDLYGNLKEVNPAFARMHGYTVEEMRGMDARLFIHPDDHAHIPKAFAAFREGEEYRETVGRDVRKDGTAFPIEIRGTRFMYRGEPHILCIVRDITERVQSQEELRRKEEQYRAVFEATTDGLAIAELSAGTVVEVNPAFARMHGYERGEMVGMHPTTFVHPDDFKIQAQFVDTARAGIRSYAEGKDVRKDGTSFRIEVHGVPFTYNNQPHVLAIMRDITERLQAEEQLKLKEEQYRAIFEATTDGLVISDLEGNVLEVNPAFAAMEGYTREELVGMDPRKWIHPDSHANLDQYLEKVKAGERFHTTGRQVRKDGTVYHAEVHEAPFMYNGQRHTLAIIRDITERVQSEELLRLKEEQYRAVWDATSDGLAIADMNGQPVDVNPAWCKMHGYTREEMLALHPTAYVHPDSLHLFAEYYEKVRAGERFQCEAVDVRKDGTNFNVEVHESPIIYNGQPHTLTILRDITERVQAYELLEQRVTNRTQELSTLLEVAANVASTLELRPLLERILAQLRNVVSYHRASITVGDKPEVAWDRERLSEATVTSVSAWGDPDVSEPVPEHKPAFMGEVSEVGDKLQVGKASIIHDVHEADEALQNMVLRTMEANDQATREALWQEEHSLLFVPLAQKGVTIGGLTLRHAKPGYYTDRDARLAMGIASQAAIAIENGRLMVQAHEKAALEERQRLARELHDSVTQSLFSINLIARSVEVMLQREGSHSSETMEKLTDLRQLTQGALAEMRALIFELRPGALEEEGLIQAIRKHAAAVQGREMLQVDVLADEARIPRLKPNAEEALYRIAQESLHNIVKHARASKVEISLRADQSEAGEPALILRVADNGIGFDRGEVPAGHMGLGTMSQRAAALLGQCEIKSAPGEGTTVTARVPLAGWELPGGR